MGAAQEPAGAATQTRREAVGWLQLRRDQESYRERVEPLSPQDAAALDQIERRQRLELRGLQLRERRSLQGERRRLRMPAAQPPAGQGREGEDQRAIQRGRLELRLQQERLRPWEP